MKHFEITRWITRTHCVMCAFFMRNRDILTASLMGLTAGYVTSNTKVRFNTFGGMMTGNTVKLGIAMQQGDWAWAGVYFMCIVLFALGTIFALLMLQKLGRYAQRTSVLLLCSCFVLVDGLALAVDSTPWEYNLYASLASSLASFALGAQNLVSQKSGVVKANTTFMTGNIQKMAEFIWNVFTKVGGVKPAEIRASLILFSTWLCYVGGGVCGAALASLTSFHWSLSPVAALYALGMWSMQVEPASKPSTPDFKPKDAPIETLTSAAAPQLDLEPEPVPTVAQSSGSVAGSPAVHVQSVPVITPTPPLQRVV